MFLVVKSTDGTMKKVLASTGVGNATVDTILPSETVQPGETVDAEVQIVGGNVQQEVGSITFEIETRFRTEEGYQEVDVDRFTIADGLTTDRDEVRARLEERIASFV
jgi:sporulation-control protein